MRLRHEVWHNPEDGSWQLCVATKGHDDLRAKIAPHSKMMHVIYAACVDEAMAAYYAWQGWETYNPMPGYTDVPYSEAWLRKQGMLDLVRVDEGSDPSR